MTGLEMKPTKSERDCGACSACCDGWVKIVVEGHEAYPGKPCPWSTGTGCSHYKDRPVDPCRNFSCSWIPEGSPLPKWFRPDQSKVVVLFDQIRFAGVPVDLAVPVGQQVPDRPLSWLKGFAETHGRPLVYLENVPATEPGEFEKEAKVSIHAPEDFRNQLSDFLDQGGRLW